MTGPCPIDACGLEPRALEPAIVAPAPRADPDMAATLAAVVRRSPQPMALVWRQPHSWLANPAFARLCGWAEAMDGWTASPEPAALQAPLIAAFAGQAVAAEAVALAAPDGSDAPLVSLALTPVEGPDGDVAGVLITAVDATAAVRVTRRQQVLLELEDRLRDRADPEAVKDAASTLLVDTLATGRVCYAEVDMDAGLCRVTRSVTRRGMPNGVGTYPLAAFGDALETYRSGRMLVAMDNRTDPRTRALAATPEVEGSGARGVCDAPLLKDGRLVAILSVNHPTARAWTADEQALVQAVAERTWAAVERARLAATLAETASQAREAAERVDLALAAGAIIGTWMWDLPTDHFTADARFAASFSLDPERCRTGLGIEEVVAAVHPDDKPGLMAAIARVITAGGPYAHQYRVRRRDGLYRWIEANGRVEHGPDGTPLRFPGVLLDVHDRRELQAERDRAAALLRTFLEAVPGVVYAKDRSGRLLIANHGTTELLGKPPEAYLGRTDAEVLDDPEAAAAIMATDARIMETGVPEQVEEPVSLPDGTPAVWLSTKAPMRDAAGAVIGLVGTSVDITERKRAEALRTLLMREVDHRARNALAVVATVVRLTRADTVPAFVSAVEGRVEALARAHTLLARERWTGSDLRALVSEELAGYGPAVALEGPSVRLSPDAVQPLAMVLHELATNAAKHGALSRPQGRVAVSWAWEGPDRLRLVWRETGGPPVAGPPGRRGFGAEVLETTSAQLGGRLASTWGPTGLVCTLDLDPEVVSPKADGAA